MPPCWCAPSARPSSASGPAPSRERLPWQSLYRRPLPHGQGSLRRTACFTVPAIGFLSGGTEVAHAPRELAQLLARGATPVARLDIAARDVLGELRAARALGAHAIEVVDGTFVAGA